MVKILSVIARPVNLSILFLFNNLHSLGGPSVSHSSVHCQTFNIQAFFTCTDLQHLRHLLYNTIESQCHWCLAAMRHVAAEKESTIVLWLLFIHFGKWHQQLLSSSMLTIHVVIVLLRSRIVSEWVVRCTHWQWWDSTLWHSNRMRY